LRTARAAALVAALDAFMFADIMKLR
jgi:hypothetical protein